MTDNHCTHEEDFGRINEREKNVKESLDRIEKKLDLWNGIPLRVKILWKYFWILVGVVVLGTIKAIFDVPLPWAG